MHSPLWKLFHRRFGISPRNTDTVLLRWTRVDKKSDNNILQKNTEGWHSTVEATEALSYRIILG